MHDKVSYRKKQFCASRISSIISCLFFSQLIISDLQSLVLEADIQIGTLLLLGCLLNRDVLTRLSPLPLSTGTHNCSNVTYKIALTLHGFVACRLLQLHGATVVAVAPFVRFPTTYLHSSLSLSLSSRAVCALHTWLLSAFQPPFVSPLTLCITANNNGCGSCIDSTPIRRRSSPSSPQHHRQLLLLIFFLIFCPESRNTISSSTLCRGSCSFFFVFFFLLFVQREIDVMILWICSRVVRLLSISFEGL